jgi:hypothetical protein
MLQKYYFYKEDGSRNQEEFIEIEKDLKDECDRIIYGMFKIDDHMFNTYGEIKSLDFTKANYDNDYNYSQRLSLYLAKTLEEKGLQIVKRKNERAF